MIVATRGRWGSTGALTVRSVIGCTLGAAAPGVFCGIWLRATTMLTMCRMWFGRRGAIASARLTVVRQRLTDWLERRDRRLGRSGVIGAVVHLARGATRNRHGDERQSHGGAHECVEFPGCSHLSWPFSMFAAPAKEPVLEGGALRPATARSNAQTKRNNHGQRRDGVFAAHFGQLIRVSSYSTDWVPTPWCKLVGYAQDETCDPYQSPMTTTKR